MIRERLQSGASAIALWTCLALPAAVQAQSAPVADPRGEFQERALERNVEDTVLQDIREEAEREEAENELDEDEAANSLQGRSSGILSKLPSEKKLEALEAKIQQEPNNLDHYFAYAQMASTLGLYDRAATVYELMLKLAPNLHRVRLDLASAYLRLGRHEEARAELVRVLEHNPPPEVQRNIENVLAKVDQELSEHDITGLVSVGVNYDSNGNSAAESDSILIFDTEIPLTAAQRAQQDLQLFSSVGVNHTYRPKWAQSDHFARRWTSSVNVYRAKQSSLEELDLQVYSLTTGPEFQSKQSGITVRPTIGRSQIVLDEQTFLRSTNLDMRVSYPINQQWMVSGESRVEFREFENSSDVSTFEDRTGTATQHRLNLRYMPSNENIFNASLTHRRERTRVEYFDNEQIGATVGYTRILPYDSFVSGTLGYRNMVFDDRDPLISAKTRHDDERSAGLTFGHRFSDTITGTIGYQYRDVNSNIQNYEFENHRYSAAISYRF